MGGLCNVCVCVCILSGFGLSMFMVRILAEIDVLGK